MTPPEHDDGPSQDEDVGQAPTTEIRGALEADDSVLGEVYRALEQGLTAEMIRDARGLQNANFVWNYRRTIDALLDGDLPEAPTVAAQTATRIRRLLKRTTFSPTARKVLEDRLAVLESRASDADAQAVEDKKAQAATKTAEQHAVPGIYVYALPHYLRFPFDAERGHTLMKVGHSSSSVIQRFITQKRETVLPEDPVLLRVYPTRDGASAEVEKRFHGLLDAADHVRSDGNSVGREWFVTSTKFLDQIASTLGLDVRQVVDPDGAS